MTRTASAIPSNSPFSMKKSHSNSIRNRWADRAWRMLAAVFFLCATAWMRAEEFTIQIGDTIVDGAPGPGAGRLSAAKESDFYSFAASAGQLAFFQSLGQDA